MADAKISALTAASALTGAELLPLVQGGANVRATVSEIATFTVELSHPTGLALGDNTSDITLSANDATMIKVRLGTAKFLYFLIVHQTWGALPALNTSGLRIKNIPFTHVSLQSATEEGLMFVSTAGRFNRSAKQLAGFMTTALGTNAFFSLLSDGDEATGVLPADDIFANGGFSALIVATSTA